MLTEELMHRIGSFGLENTIAAKEPLRIELERLTREFEARGGVIKQCVPEERIGDSDRFNNSGDINPKTNRYDDFVFSKAARQAARRVEAKSVE